MSNDVPNITGAPEEAVSGEAALGEFIRYLAAHHIWLTFPRPDEGRAPGQIGDGIPIINPPVNVRIAQVVDELKQTIYTTTPVPGELWAQDTALALMLALRNFLTYKGQMIEKAKAGQNGSSGRSIIKP